MTDPEVLALASEQQRLLVSHDVGTMPSSLPCLPEQQKTLRRRIPCSAEPRRADSNRRLSSSGIASEALEWENDWFGCRSEKSADALISAMSLARLLSRITDRMPVRSLRAASKHDSFEPNRHATVSVA